MTVVDTSGYYRMMVGLQGLDGRLGKHGSPGVTVDTPGYYRMMVGLHGLDGC